MSTTEMTLPNWLELGGYLSRFPQLRDLWLELLHEYGPAAASKHCHLSHTPLVHDLTFEEVTDFLNTMSPTEQILSNAWCNILVGASPQVALQMVRTGTPGVEPRAGTPGFDGRPGLSGAGTGKVGLSSYVSMALASNPRLSRGTLVPLVDEGILLVEDISGVRPRAQIIEGANYRWGHGSSMYPLVVTLRKSLREDPVGWRLFFDVWDDSQPAKAAAEMVAGAL